MIRNRSCSLRAMVTFYSGFNWDIFLFGDTGSMEKSSYNNNFQTNILLAIQHCLARFRRPHCFLVALMSISLCLYFQCFNKLAPFQQMSLDIFWFSSVREIPTSHIRSHPTLIIHISLLSTSITTITSLLSFLHSCSDYRHPKSLLAYQL